MMLHHSRTTALKSITVDGQNFEYRIRYESLNGKSFEWTNFYQGTETKTIKKFFGGVKEKTVPKFIFRMYGINIEDPDYSKDDIKKKILRHLEIKKGEIV